MNYINELPNSAMGVMRMMPSKASEIAVFATQLIKSVKEGNTNALELHVLLKALELLSKEVREEIEDNVMREVSKYSEKKFNAFGAMCERGEVGTSYNYEISGDSEWEWLDSQVKNLTDRRKERETFLRAIKEPMQIISADGVSETIKPPMKKSKEGVKVYIANVK